MKNVKIIIADIGVFANHTEEILTQIAPCYAEKYKRHKIKKDAQQELVSGFLLKCCLGICKDEQLTYNEHGKPSLASNEQYFNLSHSEDYVVLAIADCEIGVDVEKIRPYHEATVKKIFTSKQKELLSKLEGRAKDEEFTRMWTRCEAVLKLKGTGFAEKWDKEKDPAEQCQVQNYSIDSYVIACATADAVAFECEKFPENFSF